MQRGELGSESVKIKIKFHPSPPPAPISSPWYNK